MKRTAAKHRIHLASLNLEQSPSQGDSNSVSSATSPKQFLGNLLIANHFEQWLRSTRGHRGKRCRLASNPASRVWMYPQTSIPRDPLTPSRWG
jgi:hypothetical protein